MFFQCKPGGLFVCFGFVFAPGYIHGFVVDSNLLGTVSNGIEKNEFCACILSPSQLFFSFFFFFPPGCIHGFVVDSNLLG